nr:MAG TPA: transcriptional prepressor [Caudoviricetes sp.]
MDSAKKAKKKYNNAHYKAITVFLNKELVENFKNEVLKNNDSQAEIIRKAIIDYLNKFQKK